MIRVLIAEDNDVVRGGLARFIAARDGFHVVGQAANAVQTLSLLKTGTVTDVLLTDLNMPDLDGIELAKYVQESFPHIKVLILTMHSREDYVEQARSAGVHGYVMKHVDLENLLDAISIVASGAYSFPDPGKT